MIPDKTLHTLELTKILDQLARYTSFSAGAEAVRALRPTTDADEAMMWQQEVAEARVLLEKHTVSLGGARDVRAAALGATRGIVLEASTLLDVRLTLRRGTTLRRTVGRMKGQFPLLGELAESVEECTPLQESIAAAIDDDAQVKDSASVRLAIIRREHKVSADRLQSRLQRIISGGRYSAYLQDAIITTRNGRYVVPVKADFKGRVPGILHDTSASGATVFIEPQETVELNNLVRELQLDEEKEVRRILAALTDEVGTQARAIVQTVEVLGAFDLVLAKAQYADALRATQPVLLPFQPRADHPGSTVQLVAARHPLLGERVVPLDLTFDPATFVLVVTGPNTGGKTVALKTLGLMVLMAQCGLHLPCTEAKLSVFDGVFADIGDEQSIEQSLSTFSSHMTNTIDILANADGHALVLLDEVGAGTDPGEGSALARAILNDLRARQVTAMVTTHHPEIKQYAVETPGVRNASMEFNLETLAPTYRLIVGLPGRSNALAIAARLGLGAAIIDDARSMIATEDLLAEELLDELHRTREEVRRQEALLAAARADAEHERDTLRQRLDQLEDERRNVLVEARRKAEAETTLLRKELNRLRSEMRAAALPLESLRGVQAGVDALAQQTRATDMADNAVDMPADDTWRPRLGDVVYLDTLRAQGEIIELDGHSAQVQVGSLKVRADVRDLRRLSREDRRRAEQVQARRQERAPRPSSEPVERAASPGLELDLRGQRVDEALAHLENYLDAAYRAGLPFARIIHGKGTGALRRAVREQVETHPLVSKVSEAEPREGGEGVTVVHMVPLH